MSISGFRNIKIIILISILLFFSFKKSLAYEYKGELSLSLTEEYNDNLFLSSTDRISDFITYISPEIGLSLISATSQFRFAYSPTFSYYSSYNELNDTTHRFSANGNFTLSNRLNLSLTESFIKSSEIGEIRAIPDVGPITERTEIISNTLSSSISYRLKPNLTYTLGGSYFYTDYKEPGLFEVKTYSGNMGLSYVLSERTNLTATARYIKYDYRLGSDATEQDYLLGITYKFSPTLSVIITGGPIITEIMDTDESNTFFGGGVDLTKRFQKGEAVLSYKQSVVPGIETVVEPLRTRTISLRLSKPLTSKLNFSISTSYSNYESAGNIEYETDLSSIDTSLTYNFRPWATFILSYSYVDSEDKVNDEFSYFYNMVFFTLRLSYSKKL